MSVRTMARVWAESKHGGSDLLMLLAIADFADDDGAAYPAVPTLAKKCRTTPRHANRILSVLRASGELQVRMNEGPRGTNCYQIVLEGMTPKSPLTHTSPRRTRPGPLTHTSSPPDVQVPKPLTPTSGEPSLNHHEPSITTIESARKRATRKCPDSFVVTDELKAWAAKEHPSIDAAAETAKFGDHTFKTAISDWPGAWRNWMRKAQDFAPKRPTAGNTPASEPAWRTEQRERNQAFLGHAAAKRPRPVLDLGTMDYSQGLE
jgi:hypothetical protein